MLNSKPLPKIYQLVWVISSCTVNYNLMSDICIAAISESIAHYEPVGDQNRLPNVTVLYVFEHKT